MEGVRCRAPRGPVGAAGRPRLLGQYLGLFYGGLALTTPLGLAAALPFYFLLFQGALPLPAFAGILLVEIVIWRAVEVLAAVQNGMGRFTAGALAITLASAVRAGGAVAFLLGGGGDIGQWTLWYVAANCLALSLVLVFFFYRDGPRLSAFVHSVLERLIGRRADHYLELVAATIQWVVNGVIGTAAAQAALAGIGLAIAGVPGVLPLALLTFVLSLIPMGPPLVWIPATVWLVGQEAYGMAIFLAVWGTFVISGVDNVLKPYLISRGGNLPLVVVLLGVFGGILAFGFMGLFLGPTLLAVAFSLLGDWVERTPQLAAGEGERKDGQ